VRGICLQYMLDDSLQASSPEIKKIFDTLWNASAFASELCFKLVQLLGLQDPGTLVTQVVLSYLGQLAAYSLMQPDAVALIARHDLLDRMRAEQEQLGLSATEIGSLLMQEWALPQSIIEDVRGIDLILVTPADARNGQHGARLALCYLCARLGERLANGEIIDLGTFDLMAQESPDFHHVRTYLDQPGVKRLIEFLHFPEVVGAINQMVSAMQLRR
jgi:HD-like signal output (HDOD) protein